MKVVIAIDSFKGSMTSMEAGNAAREGVLKALPEADVVVKPLADGGEGTTEALVSGLGGRFVTDSFTGPMGDKVTARYGIVPDKSGEYAVMEMAETAGIILVDRNKLDPHRASTTGVGEMILHAVKNGCRSFILGIGGSATTEGGIGMLTALGYEFLDVEGNVLPPVFSSLEKIASIKGDKVPKELDECEFKVACDVKNPLCGESGAVYIYGPQKGVKEAEKAPMDRAMAHYAKKAAEFSGNDYSLMEGAGAAGGLGFALKTFLKGATLLPGIKIVLDAIGLEGELSDADIVITGEGRMDGQTAMGKVPVGTAKLAKAHGCKVIGFAGGVTEDAVACNCEGIDAFFPIVRGVTTLDEAMESQNARKNMTLAVEQVFNLFK